MKGCLFQGSLFSLTLSVPQTRQMNYKTQLLAPLAFTILAASACAQSKKTAGVKSGNSYARVLEATVQRTSPGAPGSEPIEDHTILIVWASSQAPQTFFWRGQDGGWMNCKVSKARKAKAGSEPWYNATEISPEKIKKNDTVELVPLIGGKFPVPKEIPASTTNTLFFKTAKTAWLSLPVQKITRKKTIVMP
jgi:hypothetical protein